MLRLRRLVARQFVRRSSALHALLDRSDNVTTVYHSVKQQLVPEAEEEVSGEGPFVHRATWTLGESRLEAEGTGASKRAAKTAAARQILKQLDGPASESWFVAQWAVDELRKICPNANVEMDDERDGKEHRQTLAWVQGETRIEAVGVGASSMQARRESLRNLYKALEPEVPALLATAPTGVVPRVVSAWAGEVNSRHQIVAARLRVEVKWSDARVEGGAQSTLSWRWVDWENGASAQTATTEGRGSNKAEARAAAAEQMLAERGYAVKMEPQELAAVHELKDATDPIQAQELALKLVREHRPAVWAEALPFAWRVMLAAEHEEGLFELVAAMEETPIPVVLWETLLDECAPITRGRGVLATRLIEELRVLQLQPDNFPGEREAEYFAKWRHLLALERQGTFLHGIQQYDEEARSAEGSPVRPFQLEVHAIGNWPYLDLQIVGEGAQKLTEHSVLLCVPSALQEEGGDHLWAPGSFIAQVRSTKAKGLHQHLVAKFLADRQYAGVGLGDSLIAYHVGMETPTIRMLSVLHGLTKVQLPLWGEAHTQWLFSEPVRSLLFEPDSDEARTIAQEAARDDVTVNPPAAPFTLTDDQVAAVRSASSRLSLIQGPPGTGKTTTGVCIVAKWLESTPKGEKILAVADSNVAADNVADKLQQFGIRCVRVGDGGDERLQEDTLSQYVEWQTYHRCLENEEYSRASSVRHQIMSKAIADHDVVVATCIGTGMDLLAASFKRVVIDECSQATESAALCALGRGAESVVLIGDHRQLPATVLSTPAARGGLSRSLFERFVDARVTTPVVLVEQRRMHPSISEFPNRQFYGGQLIDRASEASTQPIGGFPWPEGMQVAFVDTSLEDGFDGGFESKKGFSAYNEKEVALIRKTVEYLLEAGAVHANQVGVLTPYAAQKGILKEALRHTGVVVDTIDGWQGMERDLILFSATRSNASGELGFVADPRRMNVMLTRARRGLVVFGDRTTLDRSGRTQRDWADWLQWVDEKGAALAPRVLREVFSSAPPKPAPRKWVAVSSETGTYYWDQVSNETTWDKPEGDVPAWSP